MVSEIPNLSKDSNEIAMTVRKFEVWLRSMPKRQGVLFNCEKCSWEVTIEVYVSLTRGSSWGGPDAVTRPAENQLFSGEITPISAPPGSARPFSPRSFLPRTASKSGVSTDRTNAEDRFSTPIGKTSRQLTGQIFSEENSTFRRVCVKLALICGVRR
ncbi:hypothetical protein JTB14_036036 [Gonioctena quinquepunctata]|nr:hypothetical protein JTB14_036036 [Gonioctena quinquepunctata]